MTIVNVLYAHFHVWKSYYMMVYVGFHVRISFAWMLDVLYTCFDIRESYLRTVEVLDTRFDIWKGRVSLVHVLY